MKICDTHNDFLTEIKTLREKIKYIKNLKNVKTLGCAVFTTQQNLDLKKIKWLRNELYILQTYTKTKLLFTVEDIGSLNIDEVKALIKLKPFCVTLTWNEDNQYAGGANGESGLTELGVKAVNILENSGIIVDTAHLNRKSFEDFCKITKFPIFNSHTNINSIYSHNRNLRDEQIKHIVKSGGFVGITIYKDFISENEISSFDVAKQIDYLIKKFGYKNFGFGTDFFGINNYPKDIKNYLDLNIIKIHLKNFGYSNKIIKHIFYKNFIKFIKNNKKYININKNN